MASRKLAFGTALLVLASIPALAQKAEPLRIEFKKGATSAAINDKVRGDEEAEYVVAAKKGQRFSVKLTSSPRRSSCFDFRAEQASAPSQQDCNYEYAQTVPQTGDYLITVVRRTSGAGTSAYKLSVGLK
jgi:hypothetical protein